MNAGAAEFRIAAASGDQSMQRVRKIGEMQERVRRNARMAVFLALLILLAVQVAHAGGPHWVVGSSYFNSSVKGQAIVWSNGEVSYYTDLGDLSSEVNQSQANTMVAAAVAVWNNVNTAAVSIQQGGSLSEDVNGSNVIAGTGGVTLPADLQPNATGEPVAIVYDADGSVIDAIEGAGASSPLACQNNGVITTVDNFSITGNIAHALVLVNGLCATTTSQIANLQYQLVRAFGRVLGLDWSQTNEEMFVNDQETADGLQGWPIMHPIERLCNGGGGQCMPNPMQLRTDDIAALNRLYPVTAGNIGSFPGKTITASATISVQGTIQFPRGQGMQGVNVVLQPLVNGVPDVRYTATAVSGVSFQGNAGNPVTGASDANGNALNRFGSDDPALEGFFDLSGVPLPPGVTTSEYQLTFEPINPLDTQGSSVGPYTTGQVTPSGTMPTMALGSLGAGSSVTQTVAIDDAADEVQSGADGSESAPASIPVSGEWTGRMTGYAHSGWFQWWARAGREFTIELQALDESGANSENEAQIVVGGWNGTDAIGAPPITGTPQPFNGSVPGLTTLPVLTIADSEIRVGLADLRGDGRPDYAYRGRVLYVDSVSPARIPVAGGQIVIQGMGFRPSVAVSVGGQPAQIVSLAPNTIVAMAPASSATGNVVLQLQDSETLATAEVTSGFSYDAQPDDAISLISAPAGTVPIGVSQALTVRTMNTTSQTPVAGVTVTFSLTEGTATLPCGQSSCSLVTAGDGTATLSVTANSTSLAQITASLTNGSAILDEFTGAAPPSIASLTPNLYIAMGAAAQWPVQVMVLNQSGVAMPGQNITWQSASPGLSVATGQNVSAASGMASNQIAAGPFSASTAVSVDACLTGTTSCAAFTVTPVHPQTMALVAWSGTVQYIADSQTFTPVVLHVTDALGHPVAGAVVTFAETLDGWTEPCPAQGVCPPAPILGQQMLQAVSAVDGSITLNPLSPENLPGRLLVTAITGNTATLNFELDAHP
jgi:hypothetical protein